MYSGSVYYQVFILCILSFQILPSVVLTLVTGKWHLMCFELCVVVSRNKMCGLSAKMILY
jgi:hypothetical protein